MNLSELLIAEIERESPNTRAIFDRIPEDQLDWKPHEKSMTLGQLAAHIAQLAGFPALIMKTDYLDFAEGGATMPVIKTTQDLVDLLDKEYQDSLKALRTSSEEDLGASWIMRHGDYVIFDNTKEFAIRHIGLNHLNHHRGQLSVYLRLLDIPIPGMYGPSADDVIS